MKSFWFWIRRKHGDPLEHIEIKATDSGEAVANLPPCVSWNFSVGHQE